MTTEKQPAGNQSNPQMAAAFNIIESTSRSLYLTGKAGTGKTTFLKRLREQSNKRMVVLAPTGIAAINASGMTIHSFFQLPLAPFIPPMGYPEDKRRHSRFTRDRIRLIKMLDLLVIDEISMVRADVLDAVDSVMRRLRDPRLPFGGVQLLMIGDLQQLPPVVKADEWELLKTQYETPYFFSSQALSKIVYLTIELQTVYRQSNKEFLEILGAIRRGEASQNILSRLNERYIPNFNPDGDSGYIRLTTHNNLANEINRRKLAELPTHPYKFDARIKGDFPDMAYPTDQTLTLKEGAQVMFLRNDRERGYYNGLMGKVVALTPTTVTVRPTDSEENIVVEQAIWDNTRYTIDNESGQVKEEIMGQFAQFPLRLAWAITIHKSQGLTFDRAIIGASGSFAHGQTYVALSRCRSLEGLVLESPLSASAIITDNAIDNYARQHPGNVPSADKMKSISDSYIAECLDSLFSSDRMMLEFNNLHRLVSEFLSRDYPLLSNKYDREYDRLKNDVEKVSMAFARQYRQLDLSIRLFDDRISKGADYFITQLQPLVDLILETPTHTDNNAVSKRLEAAVNALAETIGIKRRIMPVFIDKHFTPQTFLEAKSKALLEIESGGKNNAKAKNATKQMSKIPAEIENRELYIALLNWRKMEMEEKGVPAYVIAHNRSLLWVSANTPQTLKELGECPGFGKSKLRLYGETILQIIADYK